jgi:hypothetical protein
MEGLEIPVLKALPFDKLNISMMAVEYSHGEKPLYKTMMEAKGYRIHKDIHFQNWDQRLFVDDFIFVKNNL